ncbi:hypothetical protein [Campylobacter coli]|uniref:hypothetical protein n=3 Tax=Campylobacter coli TaxID=195 RepID=UPI001F091058|nr:hypothetical protein [Campylobacter coli]MCH3752830.1 hypothetical protein [Campylobacter coli]MDC8033431.1 hypothetical protein [Campylobacter coli]MDC8039939.1 hypothetical protein [Campylobacter coli]HEC0000317.1 hypothetical protein [Campylobacter coli]HEC0009500.1 hypothetical protein [Campylobacter coli]
MADLEQVVNDLNLASQSLQGLREKYDGALDLLDNKNTQITGALDSAKSDALQEIQTISDTATSQISQLKDTSLNLVNEAKNTATTEISNKKEEHKQELETKKNEYINEIDAKANEYNLANINAQVQAMDTKITEQINGAKTELNSKIDNKVTKTGDETIAGVKTFSSSIVIPNATANNHATNLGQLNSKVAKTGDETIAGIKTFNVAPVCSANPTQDTQLARKSYVDYGGGIRNLGTTGSINLDLRQAQHFILTMTARGAIGIANWGGAGKSGTITVNNAQNITAFSAPFKFRIAQSGFSGTETFAYFCIASNNVRLVRT